MNAFQTHAKMVVAVLTGKEDTTVSVNTVSTVQIVNVRFQTFFF